MQKSLLLAAAVLIAVLAGNAIAQQNKEDVAILKCNESPVPGGPANLLGGRPAVLQFQATFATPPECVDTVLNQRPCAPCLQTLIRDFRCEGGSEFTSNAVVVQPSGPAGVTVSITMYTFGCNARGR
jgi:hypothetical protein